MYYNLTKAVFFWHKKRVYKWTNRASNF